MGSETNELELRTTGSGLVDRANALAILDDMTYEIAGQLLVGVKGWRKAWAAYWKPTKQKIDAAKKDILDKERDGDIRVAKAEEIIGGKINVYRAEQDRKKRELEAKLQAEARKQAEDEQMAEAEYLDALGEKEAAEKVLDRPVEPVPVFLGRSTPKVTGLSFRPNWKFRVIDADLIPREYLLPDDPTDPEGYPKIGKIVRDMKGQTNIPGIVAYEGDPISVGRGGGSGG